MLNKTKTIFFSIALMMCSFMYAEVIVGLGAVTETSAEITMDTPSDVGGFQFDVIGANVTAGAGGLAADAGFTVSTGGETVLGFSFSGGFIPAGSNGVLTNLSGTFPEDVCLSLGSGAISDTSGGALEVTFGESDCDYTEPCDEDADNDGVCDDVDDCVGEYEGIPTLIDFKTAKKIKKREWIEDYFLQGCAYANAHNVMFGTNIEQIVILMVDRNSIFQEFIVRPTEFKFLTRKWKNRLIEFNNKYNV